MQEIIKHLNQLTTFTWSQESFISKVENNPRETNKWLSSKKCGNQFKNWHLIKFWIR